MAMFGLLPRADSVAGRGGGHSPAAASRLHLPLAETGRQAVELLLRSIAGEPVPEKTPLLPVELIVRDSCGGRPAPGFRYARPEPQPDKETH